MESSPVLHPGLLQRAIGNLGLQDLADDGALQARLTLRRPGDRYEPEADRVAEQIMSTRDEGRPLPEASRAFFEPRFGQSFAGVRIHADSEADALTESLRAEAFTHERSIYFRAGTFDPASSPGKHLLAHELTHVLQQQRAPAAAPAIQRVVLTDNLGAVTDYEFRRGRQRATTRQQSSSYVRLSYDDATGHLTCTFPMRWRFPPQWSNTRRQNYIRGFEQVVRGVWQDRFTLEEVSRGRPTGRRARVMIAFDSIVVPDFGNETDYVRWLISNPTAGQRWTMSVSPSSIRDTVHAPTVELDPASLSLGTERRADILRDIRDRTYRSGTGGTIVPPPYEHYRRRGVTPTVERRSTFAQTPAAHEFGHMLGLADEYILSSPDFARLVRRVGQQRAEQILRQRRRVTDRVMNAGERVDTDHYQPFVEWISSLTHTDWRVGTRVTRP